MDSHSRRVTLHTQTECFSKQGRSTTAREPTVLGSRPLVVSLMLFAATVAGGLAIRFFPLGLPSEVTKYGGSTLWALMLYWIVSTALPSWRLSGMALLAGSMATTIEFAKLSHSSSLDAFRLTLPGILLLGRFFSLNDIAAYWFAIIVGAFLDRRIRLHLDARSRLKRTFQ